MCGFSLLEIFPLYNLNRRVYGDEESGADSLSPVDYIFICAQFSAVFTGSAYIVAYFYSFLGTSRRSDFPPLSHFPLSGVYLD